MKPADVSNLVGIGKGGQIGEREGEWVFDFSVDLEDAGGNWWTSLSRIRPSGFGDRFERALSGSRTRTDCTLPTFEVHDREGTL
jgi:hypothetical protein